jgi:anaerobic magnesium-protoporphyrin IX monomethyl ester cyclase
MYLASMLRKAGYEPGIIDCRKEGWNFERFEKYFAQGCPPVVGIKCHSNEVRRVARMADIIRRLHPDTVIIVGGPHPSMDPRGCLSNMPSSDYVFMGESEVSLVRFMRWVKGGPGLCPRMFME